MCGESPEKTYYLIYGDEPKYLPLNCYKILIVLIDSPIVQCRISARKFLYCFQWIHK